MRFNKTLTLEASASDLVVQRDNSMDAQETRERSSVAPSESFVGGQSLDAKLVEQQVDSHWGVSGLFIRLKNDFTVSMNDDDDDDVDHTDAAARYQDPSAWHHEKREKVKRVRFVICTLALLGLAFALMSRLILNLSIVEMVRVVPSEESVHDETTSSSLDLITTTTPTTTTATSDTTYQFTTTDQLLFAATADEDIYTTTTTTTTTPAPTNNQEQDTSISINVELNTDNYEDDGLRFDWTKQDVNLILGSFYIGYAPGILFSGQFAQRYGAKYPMLICVLGTAIINLLTPTIARLHLNLLIASRILLGLIQGSLFPSLYELFNKWLTQTESSIFAPMIKVSIPFGSLIGTIMPGLFATFQLDWPILFYIGGLLCFVWSGVWFMLATSTPQTNPLIEQAELDRIMRKKMKKLPANATLRMDTRSNTSEMQDNINRMHPKLTGNKRAPVEETQSTPWLLIVTNPSVLALTLVKFTYNIGLDLIFLQLAVYLREVHNAPMETISIISSGGYCMQLILISFVGWLAKVVIIKRVFGLSVTKWRKIFQGGSNFLMALTYFILAYSQPQLELATALLLSICFFWMFGAGGESLVPYDLSSKYPASIVGFAHSVSVFSAIALTAICGLVLGQDTQDPGRWSLLFFILSGALALGGLVFVLVLKAKPFLPGEKVPKTKPTSQGLSLNSKKQQIHGSTTVSQMQNIFTHNKAHDDNKLWHHNQ